MDMDKRPLPADEKTKIIPQNLVNQQRPAPPAGQPAVPKTPFGSFLPGQDKSAIQKKKIISGLVIGGGILAGGLLLTSFIQPGDETTEPAEGNAVGGAGGTVPAVISTSLPVSGLVADDLSFEDARDLARAEIGADGLFTHQGIIYTTKTEEEMELLTPEERESFMRDVVVEPNTIAGTEVDVDGQIMEVKFPLMERYAEVLVDEDGHAYSRDRDGNVNLLDNVAEDETTGGLYRTDPETGEVTQFNPTAILQNVDEGRIDISIYPSDVEITDSGEVMWQEQPVEPIDTGSYITTYNADGSWTAGYDYDGDGVIDQAIENSWDTTDADLIVDEPKSEADLLNERIAQIADEAGIDDVRKIKIHETEDGFKVKIKGEDGEKIKLTISHDELQEHASHDTDTHTSSGEAHDSNSGTQPEHDNSYNDDGSQNPDDHTVGGVDPDHLHHA